MSYIAVDKSAFDEAIEWVNENFAEIPKDDLLRLYAFYKIANGVRHEQNNKQPVVSAFKANSINMCRIYRLTWRKPVTVL